MNIKNREIDHIVYCVSNLEEAIEHFENSYGLKPTIGGRHHSKGTKNALLNLGNGIYLEILAIDHENKNISPPRWMGVDEISESKITRWSLRSTQLKKDQEILQSFHKDMGVIEEGSRETPEGSILKWKMILPLSSPEVELLPFMTDWSLSSSHPTDKLEQHCSLEEMNFSTSSDDQVSQKCFNKLFDDATIKVGQTKSISIKIKGPKGSIWL